MAKQLFDSKQLKKLSNENLLQYSICLKYYVQEAKIQTVIKLRPLFIEMVRLTT